MVLLRTAADVLLKELVDEVEVARFGHAVVVVAVGEFFPYDVFGSAETTELLHVRRTAAVGQHGVGERSRESTLTAQFRLASRSKTG